MTGVWRACGHRNGRGQRHGFNSPADRETRGNVATLSVIACDLWDFPLMEQVVTVAAVRMRYAGIARGAIERYALPHLGALNVVMHDALACDPHATTHPAPGCMGVAVISSDPEIP